MERIRLNKSEKQVLLMVAEGQGTCPAEFPQHIFNACARSLQNKGLVQGAYQAGGGVEDTRMTQYGRQYLAENPRLINPVEWSKWATLIAAISAVVSIVALFVACSRIGI